MSDEPLKTFGDETDRATQYCTYCPKLCRFTCPVAEAEARETVTPWGLMRLLELARRGDVALDEEVAEVFHHCTGCGRCQTWCLHGNDVAGAMVKARAWTLEEGVAPPVIQQALEQADAQGAPWPLATFTEEEIDACFDPMASVAYVPDCRTVATRPELVLRAGRLLRLLLGERVRLVTSAAHDGPGCCGAWWQEAGDVSGAARQDGQLSAALSGATRVITECPGMWRGRQEGKLGVEHVLEVIAARGAQAPPALVVEGQGARLFEDCQLGRRAGLGEVMRAVAALVFGEELEGFAAGGEQSPCCGAGGTYPWVAPQDSALCAGEVLAQARREGAARVVCGASGCKHQLGEASEEEDGVLDLLEAACLAYGV